MSQNEEDSGREQTTITTLSSGLSSRTDGDDREYSKVQDRKTRNELLLQVQDLRAETI
jgi:hypothetical protein